MNKLHSWITIISIIMFVFLCLCFGLTVFFNFDSFTRGFQDSQNFLLF